MVIDKKGQLQHCARKIFAEKLRRAGFVSYNGEDLSWYRVVNHQVLHSVYFFSRLNTIPLFMSVGYGHHPLFIPAPIPQKLIFSDLWDDEVMQWVRKPDAQCITYDGTWVMCHNTEEHGAEILDADVFPVFGQVNTEEDAYRLHRAECVERIKLHGRRYPGGTMQIVGSEWLADEAIYFADNEIQNIIIDQLIRQKESMEKGNMASTPKRREWYQLRIEAIQSGEREKFLMMLEARKKRFTRSLEKKLGIQI